MKFIVLILSVFASGLAYSSTGGATHLDLTQHWVGYASLLLFVLAYCLVILEEQLHLRKSKPVLLAAGLIWVFIAFAYNTTGDIHSTEVAIRHNFLEYAELFFFLLVAMTYINAMLERGVFDTLRDWLVLKGFSYRTLFWLTGILAFRIGATGQKRTILSPLDMHFTSATFTGELCWNSFRSQVLHFRLGFFQFRFKTLVEHF